MSPNPLVAIPASLPTPRHPLRRRALHLLSMALVLTAGARASHAEATPESPIVVPAPRVATAPAPAVDPTAAAASVIASPAAAAQMEVRLGDLDRQRSAFDAELSAIAPRRALVSTRARARGRSLYKMIRAGLMPLSGGFSAFVDHAQRVERLKHSVEADLNEETRLTQRAATILKLLDGLSKERAELSSRKALVDAARIAIDEERRRREAFERAFATSGASANGERSGDDDGQVVYGGSSHTSLEGLTAGSFKSHKGRLTFPVAGQGEAKVGSIDGGPALIVKAPLGALVRAAHAGRVAFADRYGTYGQLVIIDHGDRCYTVSGNLGSIEVHVGDEVAAGERIGTVGTSGTSDAAGGGAALYFEVRIGNDKVPPGPWLGL